MRADPQACSDRPAASRLRGRGVVSLASGLIFAGSGLFSAGANSARPAQSEPCWVVLEESDERVVLSIEVAPPQWVAGPDASGGVTVAGFDSRDPLGAGLVPALHLHVALPPEGMPSVRAEAYGVEGLDHALRELSAYDSGDREPGGDAGWIPVDGMPWVQMRRPSAGAFLRVLPLRVYAVRAGPDGALYAPRGVRITVEFPRSSGASRARWLAGAAAQTNPWLQPQQDLVVNPDQAARWQGAPDLQSPPRGRSDSFGSSSTWLRLSVGQRGIYVLTAGDLRSVGIEPATVDLASLRLFSGPAGALPESTLVDELPPWMEPCALSVEDNGDPVWDDATRVYFLGNGPDGWVSDLGIGAASPEDRYFSHPYSERFTYWLTWGGSFSTDPLWVIEQDAAPGSLPRREEATARVHAEPNLVYNARPRDVHLAWPRYYALSVRANMSGVGASFTVPLPGIIPERGAALRIALWGGSWGVVGPGNDHYALMRVNGSLFAEDHWEALQRRVLAHPISAVGAANVVALYVPQRYDDDLLPIIDHVYLDWAEFDYTRHLQVENDSLAFFVGATEASDYAWRVRGLSTSTGWLLWDASSARTPVRLIPELADDGGPVLDFRVVPQGSEAHLVLLRSSRAARPSAIELVEWEQDRLRERDAAVDYLVVTDTALREPADSLAAHRRTHFYGASGTTIGSARVAVVTMRQVYDEFAWGQRDPTALRNFLAYARRYWTGGEPVPPLSQVVLVGDGSIDPRDYLKGGVSEVVPAYQMFDWYYQSSSSWAPEFFGDDWFALLDGPLDERIDLAIGRLPARNEAQAWSMVRKLKSSETQAPLGRWRTDLVFAADDICQGNAPDGLGFTHMVQTEGLCDRALPPDARAGKLYLYEYGTECRYERKPEATADLLKALDSGALLFNYVGHGSEVQLADERLLDGSSLSSLANYDRPFFMITASCAVGRFAQGSDGLAVQALQMPRRGALGVVSATATASSGLNFNLNYYLLSKLFPAETLLAPRAFGPALLQAKWTTAVDNDRRYNLLGDPGGRFAVPGCELELRLEGVPGVPAGTDTLIRGAPALLRGRVIDTAGDFQADFAGQAEVWVLDSDIHRSPLDGMPSHDYELPGARIFSGSTSVAGGEFALPFFVPTALRSGTRGPARIYAYARRTGASVAGVRDHKDAAGALVDVFIPETRVPSTEDTTGPTIDLQWANPSEPVQEGSWLVATLHDASGVYVAGLSPSRSVVLTIADRDARPLVAADLASDVAFGDDFRTATVRYAIPAGLPSGESLTLAVEASDNVGRRSRAEETFSLGGGTGSQGPLLQMVYNIPNPMELETRFLFELDREADLELTIYTSAGRRIQRLRSERLSPARAREFGLFWDGRDADGDRIANGVYFYRVLATDREGHREERIERLAVLR